MKKLTAILLALTLLLSLTACGDAISGLLNKDKTPDSVQAKEPEIPGVTEPSGGDAPAVGADPAAPVDSAEPTVPAPEPETAPSGGEEDGKTVKIMTSHTDVTLFHTGETFRFTVWDSSGNDPDACTYTSADPAVAAVDEGGGEVTAVAPGTTTITARVEFSGEKYEFDCIVRCRWEADEPGLPGSEPEPESPAEPDAPVSAPSSPSLSGFFSTLQGTYEGLGMMMALDGELLDNYYPGLSGVAAVEEALIYESAISINNKAIGLVRLSDSASMDDVLQVQSILQSRITAQAEGGAFYPDACDTWENGVITSVSNCVGMFVYPDGAHSMASLFTDTFGN